MRGWVIHMIPDWFHSISQERLDSYFRLVYIQDARDSWLPKEGEFKKRIYPHLVDYGFIAK